MPTAVNQVTLWRRLAIMLYDCFALFAVGFVAGGVVVALHRGHAVAANSWWFTGYLMIAAYGYFGYCWHRGQTLGMRSWQVRIIDRATGDPPSWRQTGVRYMVGLLSWLPAGMGFWSSLFDREGRSWHDRASGTDLVRV